MTGAFEITLPAVALVRLDAGEEDFLTGNLVGHISGRSEITLSGAKVGDCVGRTTPKKPGTLNCSNGLAIALAANEESGSSMNGVVGQTGVVDARNLQNFGFTKKPSDPSRVAYVAAFGWGKMANEAAVRPEVNRLAATAFE